MRTRAPQRITVLGQTFKVRFHKRIKSKEHGELNGWTHVDDGIIRLATHPVDVKRVETYLHEFLHVVLGTGQLVMKGTEEQFVGALAPLLLHTLRENPDVVTYLMNGDRK